MNNYKKDDKCCKHCGGNLSDHCCGTNIIRWCDDCGSNSPDSPPNINIEFTKDGCDHNWTEDSFVCLKCGKSRITTTNVK